MDVSNSTKLIRLKSLKAVLGRFYDRGYFRTRFWASVKIRVDSKVKQPATPEALDILLSLLDLTDYFQLRDAVAVLLMYRTGIRVTTLCKLEERHIDFNHRLLRLSGDITKNRQSLALPLDSELLSLIEALIEENDRIRRFKKVNNTYILVSKDGHGLQQVVKSNVIQKRLYNYSAMYGLKNISPHAIRRAYARNLYDRGASLPVISKALGHQDFKVTAKYLNISNEELIDSLRKLQ